MTTLFVTTGCEEKDHDDDTQTQEETTETQPTQSENNNSGDLHPQYYGNWTGTSTFDYMGTNYTARTTGVKWTESGGTEYFDLFIHVSPTSDPPPPASSFNFYVTPYFLYTWESETKLSGVGADSDGMSGPIYEYTVVFSSSSNATITFSTWYGGFSLPITKM